MPDRNSFIFLTDIFCRMSESSEVVGETISLASFSCLAASSPPRKECPECGKFLTNVPEHLKSVHWKVRNFSCPDCPYVSSFSSDLAKHVKARHPDCMDFLSFDVKLTVGHDGISTEPTFVKVGQVGSDVSSEVKTAPCPFCNKLLANVPEHVKAVHNKRKSFFCGICDYKTMFRSDLVKHEDSVHKKLRKSCPDCGKNVANVHEHVRLVHKKEKKFKCNVCAYMCSKQADMKKHSKNVHKL